ncbi:MAG: urease accessory protein UreF [Synechococcus sp.]
MAIPLRIFQLRPALIAIGTFVLTEMADAYMRETPPAIADPQLWLLQLSDSALPIGSYSHSWGLETAVQADRLKTATQVVEYLTGLLHQAIAPQDGAACVLAHRYGCDSNDEAFWGLQLELTAARWATEPLNASLQLGDRLNRWARSTWGLSCPASGSDLGSASIHHCAVFGWLCSQAGLTETETIRAYLLGSLTSLVSAAVRLVPLGHSQGQQVLATLHGEIAIALPTCLAAEAPGSLHSFAPLLERDCHAHRTLYSRLFQS